MMTTTLGVRAARPATTMASWLPGSRLATMGRPTKAVLLALQARPEMMAGPVPRRENSLSTT